MTPQVPGERVLSTLNEDGTRHWIRPRLAKGRFLRRRRIAAAVLIGAFVALPFVRIGGRPALLLDLVSRELSAFGLVFRPSDGFVLMWLGLSIVAAVFLVTALFGRVWCGWGCPQTVYLEHVFRPIERWLEGTPAQQRRRDQAGGISGRRVLKWAIYAVLSLVLANVFLAYFVGVERLRTWVIGSPLEHPGGFAVVLGVAGLMLFDFGYFREQTCIVACPYGRLQSVLLDRQSLIVGYDAGRGEPRARPKRSLPVVGQAGDCVDCGACVAVCPTGIDIREGLQMECVGCAQCIDACDTVMDKLRRPRGLIGYTSQAQLAGQPRRVWRVRTIVYPALLVVAGGLLAWSIAARGGATIWVERVDGPSFVDLPDGRIAAQARIKIENATDDTRHYVVSLAEPAGEARLRIGQPRWRVESRRSVSIPLFVELPREAFTSGRAAVRIQIDDDLGERRVVQAGLLGPAEVRR